MFGPKVQETEDFTVSMPSLASSSGVSIRKHGAAGAGGAELLHQLIQADALVEATHARAVEGDDLADARLIGCGRVGAMQQVEDGRQMPAQAVAGDGEGLTGLQQAAILEILIPGLHVADLAPGVAGGCDLQGVGGLVVACGIVDELGAAEGHDEFPRLGSCCRVVLDALEQCAAEAGGGVGSLVYGDPVGSEAGSLSACEAAGVVIAFVQCINQQLPCIAEHIGLGVEDECLCRHLKVDVFEVVRDIQTCGYFFHFLFP